MIVWHQNHVDLESIKIVYHWALTDIFKNFADNKSQWHGTIGGRWMFLSFHEYDLGIVNRNRCSLGNTGQYWC